MPQGVASLKLVALHFCPDSFVFFGTDENSTIEWRLIT